MRCLVDGRPDSIRTTTRARRCPDASPHNPEGDSISALHCVIAETEDRTAMTSSESDVPGGEAMDQALLFTCEEFEQAWRFICPPEEAPERASHAHDPNPDPKARSQPSYISSDLLDLLALVSDSCAERVEKIWEVTPEDARARRATIAREYGLAP